MSEKRSIFAVEPSVKKKIASGILSFWIIMTTLFFLFFLGALIYQFPWFLLLIGAIATLLWAINEETKS